MLNALVCTMFRLKWISCSNPIILADRHVGVNIHTNMSESIVEWFGVRQGDCGYCKSTDSKVNHGMWAHRLSCEVYEQLIDRGWRRIGMYCYKPLMKQTCCPQYTIRCDASLINLSKSQKKVLKRMRNYLVTGSVPGGGGCGGADEIVCVKGYVKGEEETVNELVPSLLNVNSVSVEAYPNDTPVESNELASASAAVLTDTVRTGVQKSTTNCSLDDGVPTVVCGSIQDTGLKTGPSDPKIAGPDPTKPKCRKAKDIRRERKLMRAKDNTSTAASSSSGCSEKSTLNAAKSIDDYFIDISSSETSHKLTTKLLNVKHNPAFDQTFDEEFKLYCKYQTVVHADDEDDITERRFRRFLIDGPLKYVPPATNNDKIPTVGLGAFHQQYRLDGKLIAVGVIDILPHCVSSKYFFYDPDYRFLSIGTYSALQEMHLIRTLHQTCPNLKYYYMGYYIESCVKMRYDSFSPV